MYFINNQLYKILYHLKLVTFTKMKYKQNRLIFKIHKFFDYSVYLNGKII